MTFHGETEHHTNYRQHLWLGILLLAVIFTAIEGTWTFTFRTSLKTWQVIADIVLTLIFSIDLYFHIKEKIVGKKTDESELFKGKKPWFIYFTLAIDVISCIPFEFISFMFSIRHDNQLMAIFRLFRLVRIIKVYNIIRTFPMIPKPVKLSLLLIASIVFVHFVACGWIILNPASDLPTIEQYVDAFYWGVTTLTTVGYGDVTPKTILAKIYTMFIMITGVGVYGIVIGNVASVLSAANKLKEQTREKMNDLAIFMKHYHVPPRLQKTVIDYYKHLYSKRVSDNDHKIISELPPPLQHELQIYMNMKLIGSVPIFSDMTQLCLREIAKSLEQMFYSPKQKIIQAGDIGTEMFIIAHGNVDVIVGEGKVVAQLSEGQIFGEIALVETAKRTADVVASAYSEVYKLSKANFDHIASHHPKLLENMRRITNKRMGTPKN